MHYEIVYFVAFIYAHRMVDMMGGKKTKLVILTLTIMSVAVWLWVVLICSGYISHYIGE